MNKLVPSFMPLEGIDKSKERIDLVIGDWTPFCTSLTNEERIGLRLIANNRESIARETSRIAVEFGNKLPKDEDPKQLETAFIYYDELAAVRLKLARMLEIVDDTSKALGVDIMAMHDSLCGYLQVARKGNTSLDEAMKKIDEYNKRFGARPNEDDELPAETPVK